MRLLFLIALPVFIISCEESIQENQDKILISETFHPVDRDSENISKSTCRVKGLVQKNKSIDSLDESTYSVEYQYYTCLDSIYKDSVNSKILYLFNNEDFEEFEWQGEVNTEMFQSYIEVIDSMFQNREEGIDYSLGWSVERMIEISQSKNVAYLNYSGYSYIGGAHGYGFISNYVFDKLSGKELELSDLVSDVRALELIADPYFKVQNFSDPNLTYEQAGYDFEKLVLNDNFYFENDSLCFFYNPYEIASYAQGPSEVKIPLKEIEHLLLIKP